jgi:hypothetical protein
LWHIRPTPGPTQATDAPVTGTELKAELKNAEFILIQPADGNELPSRDFG